MDFQPKYAIVLFSQININALMIDSEANSRHPDDKDLAGVLIFPRRYLKLGLVRQYADSGAEQDFLSIHCLYLYDTLYIA